MNDTKKKEAIERLVKKFIDHGKKTNQKINENQARQLAIRAEKINRRNNNG
jgi:hypothetical protein